MERCDFLEKLIPLLKKEEGRILIQTHQFPDPDAVAAAFGIQGLLEALNIPALIIYSGTLQRYSLIRMIETFNIPLFHYMGVDLQKSDRIILVDGYVSNSNVEKLGPKTLAVVDHHIPREKGLIPLEDIRPHYGSSSSIICEYYQQLQITPKEEVASALYIGIARDTDLLTRQVSLEDLAALTFIFPYSRKEEVSILLRNNLQLNDLDHYRELIKNLVVESGIAFVYLPHSCPRNLLGILADFTLSILEVDFAALFAQNDEEISLSFRSYRPGVDASEVIHRFAQEEGGQGGGHREMAGGSIPHHQPNPQELEKYWEDVKRIIAAVQKESPQGEDPQIQPGGLKGRS